MKYKFSISKEEYSANLAELEEWLHNFIDYEFGWLGEDHYYIILDGLDERDATMYNIKYKLSVVEVLDEV